MRHTDNDLFYRSKQFQSYFENSPRSLVVKANVPHFTILAVSNSYLQLVHKERHELLGKGLFEVLPGSEGDPTEQDEASKSLLNVVNTKASDIRAVFRYEIFIAETGKYETHHWSTVHEPVLNEQGDVDYIINTSTNISERIQLEHAIKESRQRERALIADLNGAYKKLTDINTRLLNNEKMLQLAIDSAKLGIWYINSKTRTMVGSPRLKQLFGLNPDEELSLDAAVGQVRDDYREMIIKGIDAAIKEGKPYDVKVPIIGHHDKKLRWVRGTGRLYPGEGGQAGFFTGTLLDITEQKADEQRKNDFITMVSHELKTPLTSITGYIQIFESRMKKAGDSSLSPIVEMAAKQIGKMTTLINGFLNVARLESGKIQIDRKYFDLALLVKEEEKETRAQLTTHEVIFAPVVKTIVNADPDKIAQVINNLISNAVKYSPAGSVINVSCITEEGKALFSVKDEGIGISEMDMSRLFDRFYRVNEGGSGNIPGFGIGLYLCYEIIQRHDGMIWAESTPGKGSTFYFTLPVSE